MINKLVEPKKISQSDNDHDGPLYSWSEKNTPLNAGQIGVPFTLGIVSTEVFFLVALKW